jgi:hypothetical protein
MLDLVQLLPHCKKDVKLDTKARFSSIFRTSPPIRGVFADAPARRTSAT